jgi:hypothetical protein
VGRGRPTATELNANTKGASPTSESKFPTRGGLNSRREAPLGVHSGAWGVVRPYAPGYEVRLKSMRTEFKLQPLLVVVVNVTTGDTPAPPCTT